MNKKTQRTFRLIAEVLSEETDQSIDKVPWCAIIPQDIKVKKKLAERLTAELRNAVLNSNHGTAGELTRSIVSLREKLYF